MSCSAVLQCRCPNIHNRWRQRGAGKSSIGSMYYSKCHGKLPLPGIFRFPANCHAPSVLLLLLVVEGIDGFAKGSVNFTIGKLIDELTAFERFVRLVGGRRNNLRLDSRARGLSSALWPEPSNSSPGGKPSRLPFTWHAWPGTVSPPNSESTPLGPIASGRIRN